MNTFGDVINGADYLLTDQKRKLLGELGEVGGFLEAKLSEVVYEVLYTLLKISKDDLTSSERSDIDRIIKEIIEETTREQELSPVS